MLLLMLVLMLALMLVVNVGFDVGVTQHLGHFGQLVLVIGMFVGRLGILLLLSAIWESMNQGRIHHQNRIGYPKEDLYV